MPATLTPLPDQFIDSIKSLPPAPRILPELLALLADPDTDGERVAQLIKYDPALTAKVLQVCNNAHFRGREPVQGLLQAVSRMGFGAIFQVVAGTVGERTLGGAQSGYGIGQGELWQHAAVAAVAGQVIARETGLNENLLFTAALLHDLGKLALSTALEGAYLEVVRQTVEKLVK